MLTPGRHCKVPVFVTHMIRRGLCMLIEDIRQTARGIFCSGKLYATAYSQQTRHPTTITPTCHSRRRGRPVISHCATSGLDVTVGIKTNERTNSSSSSLYSRVALLLYVSLLVGWCFQRVRIHRGYCSVNHEC